MGATKIHFLDLPSDILELVFLYLRPKTFLALCSINKAFYELYHHDPTYWRVNTSATFRLPVSPLLQADGTRWKWLYRKMRTQTRPFTWGRGVEGNLGCGTGRRDPQNSFKPVGPTYPRTFSSWPTEAHVSDDMGIIVDLQCGGWSTTVLTADGELFSTGLLDAADGVHRGEPSDHFIRLDHQACSPIRQFSSGRRHVLALTDDGKILSWDRYGQPAAEVEFTLLSLIGFAASRVIAGWRTSSGYVPTRGIVFWSPVSNLGDRNSELPILESVVPCTSFSRAGMSMGNVMAPVRNCVEPEDVGEVLVHIVLESYIVFITHLSKIFAYHLDSNMSDRFALAQLQHPNRILSEDGGTALAISEPRRAIHPIFEVPGYTMPGRELQDLQGSFRTFAVFTAAGDVMMGNTTYLDRVFDETFRPARAAHIETWTLPAAPLPKVVVDELVGLRPDDVPALQRTGVVGLAFGDYHYHALHSDGSITAYGTESKCCGSLGLGDTNSGARFRGLQTSRTPFDRDGRLLGIANRRGRRVWFEREKREWLKWMETAIQTTTTPPLRPEVFTVLDEQPDKQAVFSEWVEQEGRAWGCEQSSENRGNDPMARDLLGAYFAISIAAAGWHSGALVIVDDEMAERKRKMMIVKGGLQPQNEKEEYVWEREPFPRLRMPDGYEFPGEGEFREWREGTPTMEEMGLTTTNSV